MKPSSFHRVSRRPGFSLVELLVAMAILSIMLIGLGSAMGYVAQIWLNGIGAMDNFTKARVVLTLLDRDIQMMVLRRDTAAFVDGSGNYAYSFYTNVQGNPGKGLATPDTRTVSLVQYLLNTPTTTPTLQRLNYGMNFSTGGATPTIGNTTTLPAPANSILQTDTVFTGIIRFQIQFVDGSGNVLTPVVGGTGPMLSGGPFTYDFINPSDAANPRSVIVSMLVLSNPAYKLATTQNGGAWMTTVLTDFPNPSPLPSGYQTYSQYWNSILTPTTGTLDPTLPPTIRGGIQVFERHIPLPSTTPSS